MSKRSPQELVTAFRDWHVPVRPYEPDGRPWYAHTAGGGFNPNGVLHHHTAGSDRLLTSDLSRRAMLRILRNGHGSLRGPLCHFAPAMDGDRRAVLWLVGWGRVHHAGLGDATNMAQVVAGQYRGRRPTANNYSGGNGRLYGLEYMHPGTHDRWPDELLEVGHRAAAAICQAHGWTGWGGARRNLDHREWTNRKIDRSWPGDVRRAVWDQLQAGPAQKGDTMAWGKRLDVIDTIGGNGGKSRRAGLLLRQTHNRANGARRYAAEARDEVRALREELPAIIEHAAEAGARKALADSTVQVDVNVIGGKNA